MRILTTNRFTKIGYERLSKYILCKKKQKIIELLLYKCSFTKGCWEWIIQKLYLQTPLLEYLSNRILSCRKREDNKAYSKVLNISPSILLWKIWKKMN